VRPAVCAALVALAACGSDSGSGDLAEIVADGIAVRDAWTRPTPATASEAAIYLEIENVDAPGDELLGGRSENCVTVQAHRTTVDDNGVARMSEAAEGELEISAGGSLVLAPNGLHLMCTGLSAPFDEGDTAEVTLVFLHHDPVTVPVAVEQR
jgi:copper(I)-binding protein